MAIIHTDEQLSLLSIRQGFHISSANAGTGKTQTSAELAVNLYEVEERKFGGSPSLRLTGSQQNRIIDSLLCLTFSRQAAAELDERIKMIMEERGIPLPKQRLCWTFDAYLLSIFRKNRIFTSFLKMEPRLANRLKELWHQFSPEVQRDLEIELDSGKKYNTTAEKLLWMTFSWINDSKPYTIIADSIVRESLGSEIAKNYRLSELKDRHEKFLNQVQLSEGKFRRFDSSEFWDFEYKHWIKAYDYQRNLLSMRDKNAPLNETQKRQAKEYESIVGLRDELLSFFGVARAFQYDPYHNTRVLCNRRLVEAFSGLEHMISVSQFITLTAKMSDAKFDFMLMEFADLLYYFNRMVRADSTILERSVEYPKLKIRRKYVLWDEVQDNSMAQHKVMESFMASDETPYLVVIVGDYKQSIYEWRGSDPFQFRKKVEELRTEFPENFHPMTCCFRSAQRIIDLGNAVVSTLPTYRDLVIDSTCRYTELGEIHVSPPNEDALVESQWVISQIEKIREDSPKASILLLFRNDPESHDGWFRFDELVQHDSKVRAMTIHKSKGSQADYVFVLSCNSGLIPSPKGGWDQEINLFYVACTRARWCVFFSICGMEDPPSGYPKVMPSMFFHDIPDLRKAMLDSQHWTMEDLLAGRRYGLMCLGLFIKKIEKRKLQVSNEVSELFGQKVDFSQPSIGIGSADGGSQNHSVSKVSLIETSNRAELNISGIATKLTGKVPGSKFDENVGPNVKFFEKDPRNLTPYERKQLRKGSHSH